MRAVHLGAAVPKAPTQIAAQRRRLLHAERTCALPPFLVSALSNRRAWSPTLCLSHARVWSMGELRRPPMSTREARVPCPGLKRRGVVMWVGVRVTAVRLAISKNLVADGPLVTTC